MATTTASSRRVATTRAITPDMAQTTHVVAGPVPGTTSTATRTAYTQSARTFYNTVMTPAQWAARPAPNFGPYTQASGSTTTTRTTYPNQPPVYVGGGGSTIATPAQTQQPGGSVGGFSNAMSGDLFGRLGLTLPKALEYLAIALAAWLGWKYLARKAGGKRRR